MGIRIFIVIGFVILVLFLGSILLGYSPRAIFKGGDILVMVAATPSQAIQADKKSRPYRGEEIETSRIFKLIDVKKVKRTNSKGIMVNSTALFFEGTEIVRKMDRVFDPDGQITERAKSLIGERVFTTAWQPKKYNPDRWWRQIYLAPKNSK